MKSRILILVSFAAIIGLNPVTAQESDFGIECKHTEIEPGEKTTCVAEVNQESSTDYDYSWNIDGPGSIEGDINSAVYKAPKSLDNTEASTTVRFSTYTSTGRNQDKTKLTIESEKEENSSWSGTPVEKPNRVHTLPVEQDIEENSSQTREDLREKINKQKSKINQLSAKIQKQKETIQKLRKKLENEDSSTIRKQEKDDRDIEDSFEEAENETRKGPEKGYPKEVENKTDEGQSNNEKPGKTEEETRNPFEDTKNQSINENVENKSQEVENVKNQSVQEDEGSNQTGQGLVGALASIFS